MRFPTGMGDGSEAPDDSQATALEVCVVPFTTKRHSPSHGAHPLSDLYGGGTNWCDSCCELSARGGAAVSDRISLRVSASIDRSPVSVARAL